MTPKQALFVKEYQVDLNATQAAIRAGYSAKTAAQQGAENLIKPEIAAAIAKAQADRYERLDITADRVLKEYARIAFYNPQRVFKVDENGLPRIDFSNATEEDWRVVAEVSSETELRKGSDGESLQTVLKGRVKHQCKLQALNQLGRHLGMFTDKVQHDFSGLSDADLIAQAAGLLGGVGETRSPEPKQG